MEYSDLVELYKKKLLERYEQCQGEKHMGKKEQIEQIREGVTLLTEEERKELLAWMQENFSHGSR